MRITLYVLSTSTDHVGQDRVLLQVSNCSIDKRTDYREGTSLLTVFLSNLLLCKIMDVTEVCFSLQFCLSAGIIFELDRTRMSVSNLEHLMDVKDVVLKYR